MNVRVKSILGVSLLALLLTITPTVVIAQGNGRSARNQIAQTTVEDETVDKESKELKARLDKRKAELGTRVDGARQTRIKNRCQASQGKLGSISGRINGLETSRSNVYANLVSRLEKLSLRLAGKGVDVSVFNQQMTQLKEAIGVFNTDLAEYKQTVADLAKMDCVADPTAFHASLEAARTARTDTNESAKEIRTLLSETIKPTLVDLKTRLGSSSAAESEDNN